MHVVFNNSNLPIELYGNRLRNRKALHIDSVLVDFLFKKDLRQRYNGQVLEEILLR
jgi:hypothetical protein